VEFGRVVAPRDAVETLIGLELPAPFLALAPTPQLVDGRPPPAEVTTALPAGACRLDLSGDMHYYARFDGTTAGAGGAPTRYAAVVSGAGGAFHHPSFTELKEVPAAAVYPEPEVSRRAVARRLFHPETLIQGGVIIIPAAALAVLVTWGSMRADTRALFDWFWRLLGIHQEASLGGDLRPLPAERCWPRWSASAGRDATPAGSPATCASPSTGGRRRCASCGGCRWAAPSRRAATCRRGR
jgi:hypothetical protein